MDAARGGRILFGFAGDENNKPKSYTLANGVTIRDFIFKGKAEGEQISIINFKLPDTYQGKDGAYPIPAEKTVKFYAVPDTGATVISADHVFTGTTGGGIICEIPSALVGAKRYFLTMVDLEGGFDLQGKTQQEIDEAVKEGKILLGKAINYTQDKNLREYTIANGVAVDNFIFLGIGQE